MPLSRIFSSVVAIVLALGMIILGGWYFTLGIGILIVFFRWKAVFAGGVAFAVLLGNTVGPTIDLISKELTARKKAKAAAAAPKA